MQAFLGVQDSQDPQVSLEWQDPRETEEIQEEEETLDMWDPQEDQGKQGHRETLEIKDQLGPKDFLE